MAFNQRLAMKLFLTIATLIYGVVPAIADLNETHLLNPNWSPHARLHGAWFLFFGLAMATLSLYLAWVRGELVLPSVIGLLFSACFWMAHFTGPLYGGALVDENGIQERVLGIEANVFTFLLLSAAFVVLLMYAIKTRRADDH